MTEDVRKRAEELASAQYSFLVSKDVTTDNGTEVYFAEVAELPGCVAQGSDFADLDRNLHDALVAYIASLLEDGLAVPGPSVTATEAVTIPNEISDYKASDGTTRPDSTPPNKAASEKPTELSWVA